jgi:hypothetical protein
MGNQIGLNDRDPNDAPVSSLTGNEKSKLKRKEYEESLRELQAEPPQEFKNCSSAV